MVSATRERLNRRYEWVIRWGELRRWGAGNRGFQREVSAMFCGIVNEERLRLAPVWRERAQDTQRCRRLGRMCLLQHADETVAPVVLHWVVRKWVQQANR